jgi:pimeloyl-ACP methyl ester carboxylesterase
LKAETRYATNREGQSVAYQMCGDGPLDTVLVPDWGTNVEIMWEEPTLARFLERLASFSRLICFDKRGTGLSDPVPLGAVPTWEEWMFDVATVMDAAGSDRAAILGHGDGASMALLFALTHPARTSALILLDAYARRRRAPDYPWGVPEPAASRLMEVIISRWGTGEVARDGAPGLASHPAFLRWRARYERLAMSPGQFRRVYPLTYELDLRSVLPTIRVPTLVLHRSGNRYVRVGNGRYLAEHIPGARFVELAGEDHFFHAGETGALLDAVQEFLTGHRARLVRDRVLATVLFTDIVGSTRQAERLGDGAWRDLLGRHNELVRRELERFGGHEVGTTGDGFFASFEGPARGVRCALTIREGVRSLGMEVRAGLHTGECEFIEGKLGGIAVHTAARVLRHAAASEVLVSRTVKDLVAGSGLAFLDRGAYRLEGLEGDWQLFQAC